MSGHVRARAVTVLALVLALFALVVPLCVAEVSLAFEGEFAAFIKLKQDRKISKEDVERMMSTLRKELKGTDAKEVFISAEGVDTIVVQTMDRADAILVKDLAFVDLADADRIRIGENTFARPDGGLHLDKIKAHHAKGYHSKWYNEAKERIQKRQPAYQKKQAMTEALKLAHAAHKKREAEEEL